MVGLGNPGPRYAETRHNVGFVVAAAFAARHGIALDRSRWSGRFGSGRVAGRQVGVLLPETFMNASGAAVATALDALPEIDVSRDLVIVYDELDLPLGRIRLRPGGGPGGHRGLASILEALGRSDVPRLRFGIGRPPPDVEVIDHVLGPFDGSERPLLRDSVDRAVHALEVLLESGVEHTMDRFNGELPSGAAD